MFGEAAAGAELAGIEAAETGALAAEAIAGRSFAGLAVASDAAGAGLFVSEELAATAEFRGALSEIAGRTGMRLVRDAQGLMTVSGSRLAISEEGFVALRRAPGAAPRAVGLLRSGRLWEVDAAGRPTRALGTVRGVAGRSGATVRTSPSADASVASKLRPGSPVAVRRVTQRWFEVTIGERGTVGWVRASELALALTTVAFDTSGFESAGQSALVSCDNAPSPPEARTLPTQSFARGALSVRGVQQLEQHSVRVTLQLSSLPRADGHGTAFAFYVPPRNGPIGTWEVAQLADESGHTLILRGAEHLPLGHRADDWIIVRAGSSANVSLVFDYDSAQDRCSPSYTLTANIIFAWWDTWDSTGVQQHSELHLTLDHLRP